MVAVLIIFFPISVVGTGYETNVAPESVMLQNDMLFKCSIPSFVSDFMSVEAWTDSEGGTFYAGNNYGTSSFEVL